MRGSGGERVSAQQLADLVAEGRRRLHLELVAENDLLRATRGLHDEEAVGLALVVLAERLQLFAHGRVGRLLQRDLELERAGRHPATRHPARAAAVAGAAGAAPRRRVL